ncbi:MAG: hypothetical protein LW806_09065 [Planctomycetaceae bacterium]|nr:hypothetical protein [Planctomycetaceae bacterium]
MANERGRGQQSDRYTLPSRREQPEEYDSQSRYGRREEAIERGQDRAWKDARSDERSGGSEAVGPRRITKAEREASAAGVWTAALFVGLTALASVSWVACAGLVLRLGENPGLYDQLLVYISAGLGFLGILGSLRGAWLLALAPRMKGRQGAVRRNAVVPVLLGLPFLLGALSGDAESHDSMLTRLSAAAPILLLAYLSQMLFHVGAGRHGTEWGRWAAILWLCAAVVVAFFGTWFWISIALSLLAASLAMLAGNGAWDHYENRIWGIAAAPKPVESSVSRKQSGRGRTHR